MSRANLTALDLANELRIGPIKPLTRLGWKRSEMAEPLISSLVSRSYNSNPIEYSVLANCFSVSFYVEESNGIITREVLSVWPNPKFVPEDEPDDDLPHSPYLFEYAEYTGYYYYDEILFCRNRELPAPEVAIRILEHMLTNAVPKPVHHSNS